MYDLCSTLSFSVIPTSTMINTEIADRNHRTDRSRKKHNLLLLFVCVVALRTEDPNMIDDYRVNMTIELFLRGNSDY